MKTKRDYINEYLNSLTDKERGLYHLEKEKEKEIWHGMMGFLVFGIIIGLSIGALIF